MRFLFPTVLIALSAAMFFVFIQPNRVKLSALQGERERLEEAVLRSRELEDMQNRLLEEDRRVSDGEKERIERFLPDSVDNVRLIIDIDGIAARYGARIRNVEVATESTTKREATAGNPEEVGSITLGFSIATSYENFVSFLRDLERSLRLVEVTGVSFTSSAADLYEYHVTVKTYWLK